MASEVIDICAATPTQASDVRLASESVQTLSEVLDRETGQGVSVQFHAGSSNQEAITLPLAAVQLLKGILREMSKGHSVAVVSTDAELTTQQAADLLNVSRPFLVEQLEKGAIAFRKVGVRRRVRLEDILRYRDEMSRKRSAALDELSQLDQQLGLGY